MDFIALISNNIGKISLIFVLITVAILYIPDEPIKDLMYNAREWILDRAFFGIVFLFYILAAFLIFICFINPFISAADIDSNKVAIFLLIYLILRSIKRT